MFFPALRACVISVAIGVSTLSVIAQEAELSLDEIESLGKRLPADVAAFVDRMVQCAHWAGEEPYDAPRKREIDKALKSLGCLDRNKLDQEADALRAEHGGDGKVLHLVDQARDLL
jgi:hypothetical protein